MNVLYIHSHDTGRYIQPYGHGIPTPQLMSLAQKGTLFRHAFSAAPTCSASRSALLTGMVPHSNGMLGLTHRGFKLHDPTQHLAYYLGSHGYETVLCGIQHESSDPYQIGYQRLLHDQNSAKNGNAMAQRDLDNAHKVADYLLDSKNPSTVDRFFLSFGMHSTHRLFPEDHHVDPNYVLPPSPLYDNAQNRVDTADYIASASVMDRCVGIVMDALCKSGLDRNTIVIYTTDHGIAFPLMKCSLYDSGIGVSLIVTSPENSLSGSVIDALVSQLDLFPTICDFAKIPYPPWLQGHSLMPLLNGEVAKVRDELFAELNFHASKEPMRCIRTERYKLIRRYDDDLSVLPSNMDDAPSKTFMLNAGLLDRPLPREMLFDLYLDPMERINLIAEDAYEQIRKDLSQRLQLWMESTADPLLQGPLVAPVGARVNLKSTWSPTDREYEPT